MNDVVDRKYRSMRLAVMVAWWLLGGYWFHVVTKSYRAHTTVYYCTSTSGNVREDGLL